VLVMGRGMGVTKTHPMCVLGVQMGRSKEDLNVNQGKRMAAQFGGELCGSCDCEGRSYRIDPAQQLKGTPGVWGSHQSLGHA